jgi:hypothetical protein
MIWRNIQTRIEAALVDGVVLYSGEKRLPFGDKLWALPIENLWSS